MKKRVLAAVCMAAMAVQPVPVEQKEKVHRQVESRNWFCLRMV